MITALAKEGKVSIGGREIRVKYARKVRFIHMNADFRLKNDDFANEK